MKFIYFFMISAISLGCLVQAQEEKDPKKKRTCRIVFPERPNSSPKTAYLFNGKKSEPVHLPSMNFSPVISLPSGEITLLLTDNPISDPENLPLGAPKLKISEGVRDFYILVIPDLSNKVLPLKMIMVNVSDGELKQGESLWFNTTPHRIFAKLGKSKMTVAPKGQAVSSSPLEKSGYYIAEFGYQVKAEGDIHRITEQSWWHDTKSRHVGFMVNTGGKLPKIYFFRDFRLNEAADQKKNLE